MNVNSLRIALAFGLISLSQVFAEEQSSIFVMDPAIFHKRQADLQQLQANLSEANEGLDALLQDADKIAKMNDQCASISINDIIGDECWDFYQVQLPAFEEKYMQVTGELRLGYMETARGLEDRKKQIMACVDALSSFTSSKEQYVNLAGGVFLEPLTQGFQANYSFTLQYEPNHQEKAFQIAKKWGETCREMVIRQDGEGFAPLFLERLERLNSDLRENGSLAVYKVDTSSALTLYTDIAKPIRSAYYLNGEKLFHSRIASGSAEQSNLRITFNRETVKVDGASIVTKFDGTPAQYKGSVVYAEKAQKMNGRWFWENQGNTAGVDFGPEFDADSLNAVNEKDSQEKAAAEASAVENRRGVHPSLWIALTGTAAMYSNENAAGYGMEEDDLMMIPDLAAAVRVKIGFGENAEGHVAVGVGGLFGAAIGDDLERLYVAPLGQFELGYKFIGFRETAIFPIATDGNDQWFQFRSGIFFALGIFNVELGHALITNMGNGGYASFGLAW